MNRIHRRTFRTVLPAVTVTALAGAGTAAASPASADVTPGAACAGVAGCRTVASAAVDGDGLFDDVALAPGTQPGTQQVLVLTSSGRPATYEVPVDEIAAQRGAWFGAARIDDRPGDELLFASSVGAHAEFFTALSFTDGYLVELPAPGSGPADDPGLRQWGVDGSASSNVGVTVERPGVVTVRSAVTTWEPADAPVYDATEQTWSFSDGAWVSSGPVLQSHPPVDAPLPQGFSGWHAAGLPTY